MIDTVTSAPINVAAAATTEIIKGVPGQAIYVTAFDIVVASAQNITVLYGPQPLTANAAGNVNLTGAWNFAANGGISKGSGIGALWVIPAGNSFGIITSGSSQASGSVSYAQK